MTRPGGRPERNLPEDGGPVVEFARDLVALRKSAELTVKDLSERAHYSIATISRATDGKNLPSRELIIAYVTACDGTERDVERWLARWQSLQLGDTDEGLTELHPPKGGTWHHRPRLRWVVAFTALLLVLAVVAWAVLNSSGHDRGLPGCSGPAQSELRISASSSIATVLGEAAVNYGLREANGTCLGISILSASSSTTMTMLARGWAGSDSVSRPDVWIPESSLWWELAKQRATETTTPSSLLADRGSSVITTPLLIAMPKRMAEALGWPNTRIGWHDLFNLVQHGWATRGHPEWGAFTLGKGNPNSADAGLGALVAAYMAVNGRTDDLEPADITSSATQSMMRDLERSVLRYGSVEQLLSLQRDSDDEPVPRFSAIIASERSIQDYNSTQSKPESQLVGIPPSDGTVVDDYPYIELGWMDSTKRTLANNFLSFLHSPLVQGEFQRLGFRDYRLAGTGSQVSLLQVILLHPLSGPILNQLLNAWSVIQKPANVLLVVDTSASMGDMSGANSSKLKRAIQGLATMLDSLQDRDQVGLWTFSDKVVPRVPLGPLSERRIQLRSTLETLQPMGNTALYEAIDQAVKAMPHDDNANNAVVVLTDGRNVQDGGLSLDDLTRGLTHASVPVYTIGYGQEADQESLRRIAIASHGIPYDAAEPSTLSKVLTAVVTNF